MIGNFNLKLLFVEYFYSPIFFFVIITFYIISASTIRLLIGLGIIYI